MVASIQCVGQSVNSTPTKFSNGVYTPNGSTQPTTSVQGGLWFNPSTLKLGIHNGTAYLNLLSETLAGTTYQTLANLQANLTASATAYPSVNAVNTGLALKANLASPALTGTPTAPTASVGTNTTQVATTAGVIAEFNSRIKYGNSVVTMDGTQTVFNLPHGLGSIPSSISLTFGDASNENFVQSVRTVTTTNIVITCANAPTAGSQTVYWQVYK